MRPNKEEAGGKRLLKEESKKREAKRQKRSLLWSITLVFCLCVAFVSAGYLVRIGMESYRVKNESQSVANQFISETTDINTSAAEIKEDSTEEEKAELGSGEDNGSEEIPVYTVDFEALQSASPYVCGWIQVSGIDTINYPIVQYDDNNYFLKHSWDGAESRYGAIFLDTRNASDFSDSYNIIYGHNMKDGSMFGQLKKLMEESFYQESGGTITIYLPEETRVYQIFSVRIVEPDDAETYNIWLRENESYASLLQSFEENSLYDTGIDVTGEEQVLTLSTCSGENRLVAQAKLVSASD